MDRRDRAFPIAKPMASVLTEPFFDVDPVGLYSPAAAVNRDLRGVHHVALDTVCLQQAQARGSVKPL
jgi:hypothetical protein